MSETGLWRGEDGMMRGPGFVVPEGYSRELAKDSVGPGWASLIDLLFDRMDHWAKNGLVVTVDQVKEKWGVLTIYASYAHKDASSFWTGIGEGYIDALSDMSAHICESCGEPGVLRTKCSWWHTSCDKCEEIR